MIESPSHPYILVNSGVLCNCSIEVKNSFILESLATCHDANTNLVIYFMVSALLLLSTLISLTCKHNKLQTLGESLALQQVREVSTSTTKKEDENYTCNCTSQFYIILTLSITIIGLVIFVILQVRRIKLCIGQLFSDVVKIMLLISDVQYYVLIKLCKTAGSIHLFKITGLQMPDKVKLNKHYIWDILEVGWKEVKVTFNLKVINLPKSITIKL